MNFKYDYVEIIMIIFLTNEGDNQQVTHFLFLRNNDSNYDYILN